MLQQIQIKKRNTASSSAHVMNVVTQGGVISPDLFSVNMKNDIE